MLDQEPAAAPSAPTAAPESIPVVRVVAPAPSPHEPPARPWELELLISGAVLFALLQLPTVLDGWFERATPHLSGYGVPMFALFYTTASMVLYALIGAFVVQLAARAYWVALVGLDTVFPEGVRWDRTRLGPIGVDFQRARQPSLQSLIDRADRFCSIIFSFSLGVAILLVAAMVPGALMFGGALALSHLTGAEKRVSFVAIAAVLLAAFVLPQTIDRRLGGRIRPDGRLARLIRGSMHLQRVLLGTGTYLPIFNVISSNIPRRVYLASMALILVTVEGGFLLKMELEDGVGTMADYALLPDEPSARTIEYQHYADEWPEGKVFAGSATIQSEVVRDPFVRLFLPFSPRRHNPAVEERCPGIPAAGAAREAAVIRCLAEIQPVTLDGRPLGDPGYRFYTDPGTGLRGLLAYVPTAGLRAGEHLLVVAPIPRAPGSDTQPPTQYIPFWVAR